MLKKLNVTVALLATLVAGSAIAQEATVIPNTYGTGTLTRAEVKADLEIWNRAGLNKLSRGESTPDASSPEYRKAFNEYVRMRSGPEYQDALKQKK